MSSVFLSGQKIGISKSEIFEKIKSNGCNWLRMVLSILAKLRYIAHHFYSLESPFSVSLVPGNELFEFLTNGKDIPDVNNRRLRVTKV